MIAIINADQRDAEGRTLYRLQINQQLIATFYHYRADGLAACLRQAAVAADKAHAERVDQLLIMAEWTDWKPRT